MFRGHPATSDDAARLDTVRGAGSIARAFGAPSLPSAECPSRSCRQVDSFAFTGLAGPFVGYATVVPP